MLFCAYYPTTAYDGRVWWGDRELSHVFQEMCPPPFDRAALFRGERRKIELKKRVVSKELHEIGSRQ